MNFAFIEEKRSPTHQEKCDWIIYLQINSYIKDNKIDKEISPKSFVCPQCWHNSVHYNMDSSDAITSISGMFTSIKYQSIIEFQCIECKFVFMYGKKL